MTRLLYVQRDRLRFPLDDALRSKWDALSQAFELRVLAGEADGEPDPRFAPASARGGAAFYAALPWRVGRELRRFRPDVVIAQSPYEGALVLAARRSTGSRARVVVDVHGDWRASTRRYGSRARILVAPAADRLAALVLRRADGVRSVSPFTSRLLRELGVEPAAEFPAFADMRPFSGPRRPLPERPRALYVGSLERVKNIAALVEAWPAVVEQVPGARLTIVGSGSESPLVEALVASFPGSAVWHPQLDRAGVAQALDDSTLLVLPSETEGFGRVIVEAFQRARPVVATSAGAIPELVADDRGILVEPGDLDGLAAAITRVLSQPALAARLSEGAAAAASSFSLSAEEHVARTRALVDAVLDD